VDEVANDHAILERLERIDALRSDDAPAAVLLDEVRALLADAEAWVSEEHVPSRTTDAVRGARDALAAGESAFVAPHF
jgi:hypothetical protein